MLARISELRIAEPSAMNPCASPIPLCDAHASPRPSNPHQLLTYAGASAISPSNPAYAAESSSARRDHQRARARRRRASRRIMQC